MCKSQVTYNIFNVSVVMIFPSNHQKRKDDIKTRTCDSLGCLLDYEPHASLLKMTVEAEK